MLRIWIVSIEREIEETKWIQLVSEIDSTRKLSINGFKLHSDKKRALIAGLLIKAMVKRYHPNVPYKKISKNRYGKPYIQGINDFHFNISHSGSYVCCAVSDSEVGIDIEKISSSIIIDNYKPFFSVAEWEQINSDEKKRLDNFYSLWTLKESYLKKIGTGLSKDPSTFTIHIGSNIKVIDQNIIREEKFLLPEFSKYYKLAVCSKKSFEYSHKKISCQDFINKYY